MTNAADTVDRRGAIRPPRTPEAPEAPRDWFGGAATVASLAWLALAGWYLATLTPNGLAILALDPLAAAVALLGIVVPVALIWMAAMLARQARTLRAETTHLREELDAMREANAVQARMGAAALRREMDERLGTLEAAAARAAQARAEAKARAEAQARAEAAARAEAQARQSGDDAGSAPDARRAAPPSDGGPGQQPHDAGRGDDGGGARSAPRAADGPAGRASSPAPSEEAAPTAGAPLAPAPASARAAPSDAPRRTPALAAPNRPARSPLEMLRAARPDGAAPAPPAPPAPPAATAEAPPATPPATPPGAPSADTVLRAFDLPRGRDDAEGFAAVRRVLADPVAGPPLAAAQTALALLAEGNLAATALPPAPPAAWRAWLSGESAPAVLGEMSDPAATAVLVGRARAEPPFAAAASALVAAMREAGPGLAARLDDDALAALDRTRTGRAARLMARAGGALDAT